MKWIKKMWYMHAILYMEYYAALQKKAILQYVTTQMDFEDVMLSKIRQTQKDKYCMIQIKHLKQSNS